MSDKWIAVPGKHRFSRHRDEQPLFDDGLWWIIREGQPELLPVAIVDRGDDHDPPTRARAAELARMISAAPELLSALKEIVAITDRKHKAWDAARAAIAKAEARS